MEYVIGMKKYRKYIFVGREWFDIPGGISEHNIKMAALPSSVFQIVPLTDV